MRLRALFYFPHTIRHINNVELVWNKVLTITDLVGKKLHGGASKFQLNQTPPTPYPHLLRLGLPSAFTLYFAQTISLRKAPLAFWNALAGGIYKFLERQGAFALGLDCKNDYHWLMKLIRSLLLICLFVSGPAVCQALTLSIETSQCAYWTSI